MGVGEDVLSMPTIVLAFFSIFSCIYVMLSITESGYSPCKDIDIFLRKCCCKFFNIICKCCLPSSPIESFDDDYYYQESGKSNNKSKEQKISMNNIIFFMCLTDLCQAIQIIFNWIPLAFLVPFWSSTSCKILGIYAQFFAIQSPLWHCMLAYNLGYLMMNGSINAINNLSKQRNYQYCVVIFIPLISCILPMIGSGEGINVYGVYINYDKLETMDKECWLIIKGWQLGFSISVLFSIIFHYIVLAIMCFKCYQYQQYNIIVQKLMRFVIVYTFIRFLPAMERIWGVSSSSSPPYWLVLSHHICIASVGICNAIVWSINNKKNNNNNTKKKDNDNHKELNNPLLKQIDTTQETETVYTSNITTTTTTTKETNINLEQLRDRNMPLI